MITGTFTLRVLLDNHQYVDTIKKLVNSSNEITLQ